MWYLIVSLSVHSKAKTKSAVLQRQPKKIYMFFYYVIIDYNRTYIIIDPLFDFAKLVDPNLTMNVTQKT